MTICKSGADNGLFQAITLQGMLARDFSHNVPILFYKKALEKDITPITITEINLDKKIIQDTIEQSSEEYRRHLSRYCGVVVDHKRDKRNARPVLPVVPKTAMHSGSVIAPVNRSPDHKTI